MVKQTLDDRPCRRNKAATAKIQPFGKSSRFNSILEMSEWPFRILELLLHHGPDCQGRKSRLKTFVGRGANLKTSFSGKFSTEVSIQMMAIAMRANGIDVPHNWITMYRGADINTASQDMAMAPSDGLEASTPSASSSSTTSSGFQKHVHYFPSVGSMLPDVIVTHLHDNMPRGHESLEEKAACYRLQDSFLKSNFQFSLQSTSKHCLLHPDEDCPLLSPQLEDDKERSNIDFSGPQCLPWCGSGGRLGAADSIMQSYYEYCALVRGSAVHWKLIENASTFPFENWVKDVSSSQSGGSWISKFAIFGPFDLGFPVLRLRSLGFQTDDSDMVWEGPPGSDVTSHFLEIFGGCCPVAAASACSGRFANNPDLCST